MTEQELLKATKVQLMEVAQSMGLDVKARDSVDTVRELVAGALGIVIESKPQPAESKEGEQSKQSKVWLKIDKSKEDKHPVPIGVNGKFIAVERGQWVEVKREYVEVLRNALQKIIDPATGEITEVPAYPHQISQTKPSVSAHNFFA